MQLTLRARASLTSVVPGSSSRVEVEDIVAALVAGAKGTPIEDSVSRRMLGPDGPIAISMHPNVGHILIKTRGDAVELEAQAFAVGPGYHVFLVSILDSIEARLGIRWEWLDETGYAQKRDFADLQFKIAEAFRKTCANRVAQIRARGDATGTRIFLPASFRVEARKDEIFTPFGPTTLKQLEKWAALEGADLLKTAADFYLWWDQGFGGSYYRGLALYWLWVDVRWATPLGNDEVDFIIRVLKAYALALEYEPDLPIPPAAITELFALVEGKLARRIAAPQGIGYRRRNWTRSIGENWRLVIPGCLEPDEEVNGGDRTYMFTTDRLDVRASIHLVSSDDPRIRSGELDGEVSLIDRYVEKLDRTFTIRNVARTYSLGEQTSVCILTITSSTPETRVIGEHIGKSLNYVP